VVPAVRAEPTNSAPVARAVRLAQLALPETPRPTRPVAAVVAAPRQISSTQSIWSKITSLFTMVVSISACPVLAQNVMFVSPGGSDANSCAEAAPRATFQGASRAASPRSTASAVASTARSPSPRRSPPTGADGCGAGYQVTPFVRPGRRCRWCCGWSAGRCRRRPRGRCQWCWRSGRNQRARPWWSGRCGWRSWRSRKHHAQRDQWWRRGWWLRQTGADGCGAGYQVMPLSGQAEAVTADPPEQRDRLAPAVAAPASMPPLRARY